MAILGPASPGNPGARRQPLVASEIDTTTSGDPLLNFAINVARDAGGVLVDRLGRALQVCNKGDIDLVTEADLASERLIIERIRSHYPRHSILAEESGASEITTGNTAAEWKWIVDPLDGTTN